MPRITTTIGLQLRIVVLVLVLMTATFAFIAVWGGQARDRARAQMEEQRGVSVQLAAARIDGLVRRDLSQLRAIAQTLAEVRGDPADTLWTVLTTGGTDQAFFSGVFLADESGRFIAGSSPLADVEKGSVLPQAALLQSLVRRGGTGVSSAVPFGAAGAKSVLMAVPVTTDDTQPGSILFGVVPLAGSAFVQTIEPLAVGETGYAEIFDSAGVPLVDTPPERAFGTSEHEAPLASLLATGEPGITTCGGCHAADTAAPGRQVVMSQHVVAFAPIPGALWGVVAAQSESEITAPLRELQWPLVAGAIVLFLFAFVFAWLAGRNVVKPLNRLMVACEGIAGGDMERPVPAVGVGEIRRLAHAFETVRDRLSAALSEVVSWNVVLEERVQEKTEDLSRTVHELQESAEEVLLRNQELQALNEVLLAAGESLDLQTVLRLVSRSLADLFKADGVTILVTHQEGETFWHSGMDLPESSLRDVLDHVSPDADGHERAPDPMFVADLRAEDDPAYAVLADAGVGSLALVLLRFRERPVASLALAFKKRRTFASRDLELLGSIGSPLALAIDRTLLYRGQQRAAARASALLGIATEISTLQSLDHVLEHIVDEAATLLGMDRARLVLFREDGLETTVSVSEGTRTVRVTEGQPSRSQELGGMAIDTGAPVWTADYTTDTRLDEGARAAARKDGVRSGIAVPLQVGDRAIGALYVGSASPNQFQEEDVSLLQGFASHAAIAIENARLFSEAAKVEALRELDALRSHLVSTVSHELRTPLAGIKAYATALLRTDVKRSERQQREYLTAIDQDCDRLTELVEESLDMSRIKAGMSGIEREALSPKTMIERAVAAIRPVARGRTLGYEADASLPDVWADSARMQQVLGNLMQNALNFSKPPSPVTVSAQLAGDEILFSVSDYGIGIQSDEQERIFEPFYRGGNGGGSVRPRGTGLGLAISKGLVEAHGGRIWVESESGSGSTFWFTLPVYHPGKG